MDDKVKSIKKWLGTGSINIFGMAFSGKDTVGKRLTKLLNADFLSSGDIVRNARKNADNERVKQAAKSSNIGVWTPTEEFKELITPYLCDKKIAGRALILSMVGRWIGEEQVVMKALSESGHPTKAVIMIDVSTDEVFRRWKTSLEIGDRGIRADDTDGAKVARRISEFKDKTLPVIEVYRQMGLLIEINGEQSRDEVFEEVIDKLANHASALQ